MPSYPTNIYTEAGGHGRIHRGHDLPDDVVMKDWEEWFGDDYLHVHKEEVHLRYVPRVKWCGNYDSPCDLEGDWHSHWSALRANDDPKTKFTILTGRP